jgi:Amt family ammonium transporter
VTQLLAAFYTTVLSGVVSFILLKIISVTIGLRVTPEQENAGIDISEHGEDAYNS